MSESHTFDPTADNLPLTAVQMARVNLLILAAIATLDDNDTLRRHAFVDAMCGIRPAEGSRLRRLARRRILDTIPIFGARIPQEATRSTDMLVALEAAMSAEELLALGRQALQMESFQSAYEFFSTVIEASPGT